MMTQQTSRMGSAHRGLGEWLLQRLSALYLAGFSLWLGLLCLTGMPASFMAWKVWMSGGAVRIAYALFFLSMLVHAWVGLRSVFLDYLKPTWLRISAQLFLALILLGLVFWAAQILLVDMQA